MFLNCEDARKTITAETCQKFIESMPRRAEDVIRSRGGPKKYQGPPAKTAKWSQKFGHQASGGERERKREEPESEKAVRPRRTERASNYCSKITKI